MLEMGNDGSRHSNAIGVSTDHYRDIAKDNVHCGHDTRVQVSKTLERLWSESEDPLYKCFPNALSQLLNNQ